MKYKDVELHANPDNVAQLLLLKWLLCDVVE